MTLGQWPRSDLKQLSEARQTLVFALEKIAVWKQHFSSAAKLLAHLCFGESVTNSNNARGTLNGLFSLRGAPTQASAMDRLNFSQALLVDSDRFNRLLGLGLCEKLLSDQSRSRIVGVEYQGLAPPIAFWSAKIWNDLFDPRRRALQLLLERSDPSDPQWQGALSKVIVESADDMLHHHDLTELALSTLRGQLDFAGADGQTLTKMLLHRIKYPYQGTAKRVTKELQAILDATGTGLFAKRFDRFVTFDTYEENYNVGAAGEIIESDLPAQRIESLAGEFVDGAETRREKLEKIIRSPGCRASEFGRRVAALSFGVIDLDEEIFKSAESLGGEINVGFLSGYLESLRRLDVARWERRALTLLAAQTPSRWRIVSVVFSGFSPPVVARLLALFDAKAVQASHFHPMGWKLGEEYLSATEVEAICERLNRSGDDEAARAAVQIASYRFAQKGNDCSADLLFSLLTNPRVFEHHHDNMTSHYWKTLVKAFRKRFPERDIELLNGIIENHCKSGGPNSFSGVSETIVEICKLRPKESWPVVASALENGAISWSISYWLGETQRPGPESADGGRAPTPIDCFEPRQILDWIAGKAERANLIMQSLPKTLEQSRAGDLTRGFIEFFGPKSSQGQDLMGHFDTGVRWGSDSAYYSQRRDAARSWMGVTTSPRVREWLSGFISMLSRMIEEARIREERRF